MFFSDVLLTVVIAITCAGAASALTLKLCRDKNRREIQENEATVALLKADLEKQNEVIKNLNSLYDKALEYDRYKTDFFSNITHELKTPLSVLLGTVQLMEKKGVTCSGEPIRNVRYFQNIKLNSYRLLRLVNNILDLTRMESGHARLLLTNCNLVYLVEEMVQSVAPYAEQKGIHLEFDTDAEEIFTAIDIDKIERVVLNLLSNAIKFTGQNGVVCVNIYHQDGKVYISVKDTGPGISNDMLTKIFERFQQVGNPLTKGAEGSGIGLSLVKSFTELHKGSIKVLSEENNGSEFIVELPLRLCESAVEQQLKSNYDHGRVIEAINIEFSDLYTPAVRASGD